MKHLLVSNESKNTSYYLLTPFGPRHIFCEFYYKTTVQNKVSYTKRYLVNLARQKMLIIHLAHVKDTTNPISDLKCY